MQTRTLEFDHDGTTYDIRVKHDREWIVVRAFLGDTPASLAYGVAYETAGDLRLANGKDAVDELVTLVKSEVESR